MNTEPKAADDARSLVVDAITDVFIARDLLAMDRYFAASYKEHAQTPPVGIEGLQEFVASLTPDFGYDLIRTVAEGDLVVTHGLYHGFEELPMVAFDVWRVAGGMITEHWDAVTSGLPEDASERSQVDGARTVVDPARTHASKALVEAFVRRVLLARDLAAIDDYVDAGLMQHDPATVDGIDGIRAMLEGSAPGGASRQYSQLYQVVAEGEFVFTRSSGTAGEAVSIHDLWRVEQERIVEHWSVVAPSAAPASAETV